MSPANQRRGMTMAGLGRSVGGFKQVIFLNCDLNLVMVSNVLQLNSNGNECHAVVHADRNT
jgi:hypothetical protein